MRLFRVLGPSVLIVLALAVATYFIRDALLVNAAQAERTAFCNRLAEITAASYTTPRDISATMRGDRYLRQAHDAGCLSSQQ